MSIENKIPMWISGSGSTILYCSKRKEKLLSIQNKIKLKTMLLNPDTEGAKIIKNDAE